MKTKTSREHRDPARLDAVRKAIGDQPELYVDANGALTRKQGLDWAHRFRHEWGVSRFEEPVTSDDRCRTSGRCWTRARSTASRPT